MEWEEKKWRGVKKEKVTDAADWLRGSVTSAKRESLSVEGERGCTDFSTRCSRLHTHTHIHAHRMDARTHTCTHAEHSLATYAAVRKKTPPIIMHLLTDDTFVFACAPSNPITKEEFRSSSLTHKRPNPVYDFS